VMPPIWVLSLARATDRRRSIEAGFGALGLPFELIDAIDGRSEDVSAEASQWRSRFEIGRPLSPGEIAASLTHLRAYQRIVDDGVPYAVIVEDDVEPTPALIDVLGALDDLPPDWDVVTLHSLFPSARPRPLAGPPLVGEFRVCTYERMPYGSQCCVVSRAAAERLLAVGRPVRFPPDDLVFRPRPARLKYYGIEPSPVVHGDFGSELGVTRADDARGLERVAARIVVTAGKVRNRVRRALVR
jgi:glycosyl transferase, family 25